MEPYNRDTLSNQHKPESSQTRKRQSGGIIAGFIVVIVGVIFLAREAGFYFPRWLFSWDTLIIAIGLFIGFKHNFRNMTWLVLVLIGSVMLIDDIFPFFEFSEYGWPIIIILIGFVIIYKASKKNTDWGKWDSMKLGESFADDFIDSTVVFGGVKKNVISKSFRGGDATTIFGGTDINLMQADLQGKAVIDLTQIFGGTKLIVPPHWKVHTEDLVAIFGGVEDKRPQMSGTDVVDQNKVIVLKGVCIFGGIDIKSY
jgi:predicted membrane protein